MKKQFAIDLNACYFVIIFSDSFLKNIEKNVSRLYVCHVYEANFCLISAKGHGTRLSVMSDGISK